MRRLAFVDGLLAAVAGVWLFAAAATFSPNFERTALAAIAENSCQAPVSCSATGNVCAGCVPGPQTGSCQTGYLGCVAGGANCSGFNGVVKCNCNAFAC